MKMNELKPDVMYVGFLLALISTMNILIMGMCAIATYVIDNRTEVSFIVIAILFIWPGYRGIKIMHDVRQIE